MLRSCASLTHSTSLSIVLLYCLIPFLGALALAQLQLTSEQSLLFLACAAPFLFLIIFLIVLFKPEFGILILVVAIPLEISRAWVPYFRVYDLRSGNFYSWFYLEDLVEWTLILVWFLKIWSQKRVSYSKSKLLLGIIVFTGYVVLSAFRAPLEISRYSLYNQVKYLLLMLAIVEFVSSLDVLRYLRNVVLIMGLILAIVAFYESMTGNHLWNPGAYDDVTRNAWTTFADRNNHARYMSIVMIFALCSYGELGWKAWLVAACSFGATVVSGSRSGLLFSVASMFLVLLLLSSSLKQRLKGAAGMILILTAVYIAAGDMAARTSSELLGFTSGRAWYARSMLVEAGWKMFLDNPVVGVGVDRFPTVFRQGPFVIPGMYDLVNSHTSGITIMAEMGIIGLGLIAYIYYKALMLFKSLRKHRNLASYATAFWVGSLVILAMSQSEGRLLDDPNTWFLMALLIAAGNMHKPSSCIILPGRFPPSLSH